MHKTPIEMFREELMDSGVTKLFLDYIDDRIRQICEQEVIEYLQQLKMDLKDDR